MSDTYQAVYDAVRSKIGHIDSSVVAEVARQAFDISFLISHAQQEIYAVSHAMQAPHVLMRPAIYPDGNMWCALYGENLQDGVCGFGEMPEAACADFDKNWHKQRLTALSDATTAKGGDNG